MKVDVMWRDTRDIVGERKLYGVSFTRTKHRTGNCAVECPVINKHTGGNLRHHVLGDKVKLDYGGVLAGDWWWHIIRVAGNVPRPLNLIKLLEKIFDIHQGER